MPGIARIDQLRRWNATISTRSSRDDAAAALLVLTASGTATLKGARTDRRASPTRLRLGYETAASNHDPRDSHEHDQGDGRERSRRPLQAAARSRGGHSRSRIVRASPEEPGTPLCGSGRSRGCPLKPDSLSIACSLPWLFSRTTAARARPRRGRSRTSRPFERGFLSRLPPQLPTLVPFLTSSGSTQEPGGGPACRRRCRASSPSYAVGPAASIPSNRLVDLNQLAAVKSQDVV